MHPLVPTIALLFCAPLCVEPVTVDFVSPETFIDATFTRGPGVERERAEV